MIHNRILRDGICAHLNDCKDIDVVAAIDSIDSLSSVAAEHHPDLVCIDLELPDGNAIEGIRRIVTANPAAWIIGLAIDEERDYCEFAIRAGAASVIPKDLVGKMLTPLLEAGPPANRSDYERPSVVELAPAVSSSTNP